MVPSRVVWARVEMRLIFVVRQCEKRLRSKSTSVFSSVMMQLPMTWQNLYLKTPWATILCAVDLATQNPLAIALPGKNAELEYAIGQLISFIRRLGYTELVIRSDGEPSITAIVDRLMAEIKEDRCAGTSSTRENTSLQFTVLGCSGEHAITVAEASANSQKTDLETKINSHFLTSMAVWPWLVRHSAWLG